ncbi:MAG: hypothetical protein Kow00117_00690 [Phototrophicales bacterium]
MSDLFIEVFPIIDPPPIIAYTIEAEPADVIDQIGRRVVMHLRRLFPGAWHWFNKRILTDQITLNPMELVIAGDALKADISGLQGINIQAEHDIAPQAIAEFIVRTRLPQLNTAMQQALNRFNERIRQARIEREHKLQAWAVSDQPALSISIASRLIYYQTVQQFIKDEPDDLNIINDQLSGLWVTDGIIRGEIIRVVGQMKDHRARLLELAHDDDQHALVLHTPDNEWLIQVKVGREEAEFLASTLHLIVRLQQLGRFNVDAKLATQMLQMQPKTRALQVRAVSDVVKNAGLIGNAYNSRAAPDHFASADFEMNIRFADNRVRPFNIETVSTDFLKCGTYRLKKQHVRVCVVNTLQFKIEDFIEAMQRLLKKNFTFEIEVIRERRVRVLSPNNLENAIRVVEKDDPDIILAFFPDEHESSDDDDIDANAALLKSLTLGRALPTHIIHETTLNDPEAMPSIIMAILGKTGSTPFVLTEPIESADYVVGLDVIRQLHKPSNQTRLIAIARIYQSDGEFLRYVVRDILQDDSKLPYVLMRDLFPQKVFSGKRIVIHHTDKLEDDLIAALGIWGTAIQAMFYPVEIIRFGAPRLYATSDKGITQPTWGSAFRFSETEAVVISSLPQVDITPQPLHIRAVLANDKPLPINEALRGVLVWTLLAYGAERLPKLPVTVINTDQLSYWLKKGNRFNQMEGDVPFWL